MIANGEHTIGSKRIRTRHMWFGVALMLILTLGLVLLGRIEPMTFERALLMVLIGSGGIFAMAILLSPAQIYSRAAWYATAAGMSAVLFLSLAVAGDPALWHEEARGMIWLLPWLQLTMGSIPARRSRACAESRPRSGWVLFGGTVVASALIMLGPLVLHKLGI